MAMGFHSVFEGIALGLQPDLTGWASILAVIVLHKWAESMSIGVSIVKHKITGNKMLILIFLYVICTPLGIIIGLNVKGSNKLIESIFMGASAGTFVYIACVEIITEEFGNNHHGGPAKNKYLKLVFYLLGLTLMGVVFYAEQWVGGHSD